MPRSIRSLNRAGEETWRTKSSIELGRINVRRRNRRIDYSAYISFLSPRENENFLKNYIREIK